MLVCWAQLWAAFKTWFCQLAADPKRGLKEDIKLLAGPPRLVPSGWKLSVINSGCAHRLPVAAYGTHRHSNASTRRRARRGEVFVWPRKDCLMKSANGIETASWAKWVRWQNTGRRR